MPVTRYPDYRKYVSLVNKMPDEAASLTNELISGIINRTQKGIDFNGGAFKRYDSEYAKRKQLEYGNKTPNLTRTQAMLNSMVSKRIKNGFRLYFGNSTENKKAKYNQETRKFFGLDKKQKEQVLKHLKNKINKL
jgi:ABC-type long-subunit fatty acid transport system fused permease/ATPase subunit